MFRHHGGAALAVLLATACQTGPAVTPEPERRASRADGVRLEAVASAAARSTRAAQATVAGAGEAREITLDVGADAVRLVGVLEPAPPRSDADRVLALHVRRSGASRGPTRAPELEGARVLDARFVKDGVVTIGVDHVLRLHRNGQAVDLDQLVEPPLSVVGEAIAYARGHPPNLEIARTGLAAGTAVAVTHGMNPAWSPALTPDGTAIVFVSGIDGTARFYRAERGAIRALPQTERTPSAPVAPRFEGGLLHFVDHLGEAWLDPERGAVLQTRPTVAPAPRAAATTEAR